MAGRAVAASFGKRGPELELNLNCSVRPVFSARARKTAPEAGALPFLFRSSGQNERAQGQRSSAEFQARNNIYQQAAQAGINANYGNQAVPAPQVPSRLTPDTFIPQGPITPVWLGSTLVLARRVNDKEGTTIQGVWLNWDGLKLTLVENIRDLFPNADLRAAPITDDHGARRLAALPVEFVPGKISRERFLPWTSVRLTLAFAWGCMLLAVAAVAVLLHGAVSLSERRGAFVSAVTHELRTPLTTFKMYSEMLADGMVPEETKRQQYLATLCSEMEHPCQTLLQVHQSLAEENSLATEFHTLN